MTAGLTATVLIPAHNEQATIGRCIEAVKAQTYPLERVIVVAYGGEGADDTARVAEKLGVEVLRTQLQSKDGKQNLVLGSIKSDVVVGFDGDTFPEPDCVQLMMTAIGAGYDAVGATVLPAQPTGYFIRARRYAYALGRRWWRWSQSQVGRVQVLTGAAYAFKTEAIKSVGGFPSVGISADMDATWALHRAGFRLKYVGGAVALTQDPETFAAFHSQMQRWASGYFQTMAKHKRGLLHPKAMLVVWTAILDLLTLPISYALLMWGLVHGADWVDGYFYFMAGRLVVNTVLVATVVGWKEALLGAFPYTTVNFYVKGLYLWTFIREWVLGRHYGSWTGRHGFPKVVRPMTFARRCGVATFAALCGTLVALLFAPPPQLTSAPATPTSVKQFQLPSNPPNTIVHPPGVTRGDHTPDTELVSHSAVPDSSVRGTELVVDVSRTATPTTTRTTGLTSATPTSVNAPTSTRGQTTAPTTTTPPTTTAPTTTTLPVPTTTQLSEQVPSSERRCKSEYRLGCCACRRDLSDRAMVAVAA